MNTTKMWKLIPAILACCAVGVASARLPAPPPMDPAKAAAAKMKKAESAKKNAVGIGKAQDRVVEHYNMHK